MLEIDTQTNAFGDQTDQAIEQLIRAAIYTSRLYVWLRNHRFRIFVTCVCAEFHWQWISGSIGKTDKNKWKTSDPSDPSNCKNPVITLDLMSHEPSDKTVRNKWVFLMFR